jgi:hypothetical protein
LIAGTKLEKKMFLCCKYRFDRLNVKQGRRESGGEEEEEEEERRRPIAGEGSGNNRSMRV